jgi:hypothetical protein
MEKNRGKITKMNLKEGTPWNPEIVAIYLAEVVCRPWWA